LTQSAQALTRMGITNENSYRYAALQQNERFHRETSRLQEKGMSLQKALQTAEQTWRSGEADRTRDHDIDMMTRANDAHKELMNELFDKETKRKDTKKAGSADGDQFDFDNPPMGWTKDMTFDKDKGWLTTDGNPLIE
jgi:hypothetical protein